MSHYSFSVDFNHSLEIDSIFFYFVLDFLYCTFLGEPVTKLDIYHLEYREWLMFLGQWSCNGDSEVWGDFFGQFSGQQCWNDGSAHIECCVYCQFSTFQNVEENQLTATKAYIHILEKPSI